MTTYYDLDLSKNKRFTTALMRFDKAYDEPLNTRPIDIMISFESLFLGDQQELAYKLAIRVAYLLANTTEHRNFTYQVIKQAYNLRSKLVHGGTIPGKFNITQKQSLDITEFVFVTEDILRESIKKFMDLLTRYSHHQLLETILDNNILAGGTLLQ